MHRSNETQGEINPFFLEQLYEDWGQPRWFWPAVFVAMFVLWGLAGAIAGEA